MLVHNGIIENYLPLKQQLQKEGYNFQSETDTEVVAHLIEKHLEAGHEARRRGPGGNEGDPRQLCHCRHVRREPERMVVARSGCPLVIGRNGKAALWRPTSWRCSRTHGT